MPKGLMRPMSPWKSRKRPATHHAREPPPFRITGYVNLVTFLEKVCNPEFLSERVFGNVIHPELPQHLEGPLTRFSHVTTHRFVDPLILLWTKAQLQRIVAVPAELLLLQHDTGPSL